MIYVEAWYYAIPPRRKQTVELMRQVWCTCRVGQVIPQLPVTEVHGPAMPTRIGNGSRA
jgi:hypothetical protein